MADPHGGLTGPPRRFWTYVDEKGETRSAATPPAGTAGNLLGQGYKPTPEATEYEERTYADGTKILSRFDPAKGEWVQESYDVDPQIRAQYEAGRKAEGTAAPDSSPKTITAADGSVWQYDPTNTDPDVRKRWTMVTPPKAGAAAAAPEAPTVRTLPSGAQEEWNPTTRKWEVHAPAKRTAPAVDLGAPRPGQKRDLRAVELAYNAFAQQLAADPNITDEEYNRRLQAYIAQNVTPAVEQAAREVEEEAARKQREQEAATARATAREERLDTAADRTEARTYAEFQQRAGQNAVSNALALLPYRANPKFLQQFSAGLNVLAGGGGVVNFTPDAFEVPLPDLDALATQGAERAAALYRSAGGVPVAPRAAGVVEPSPAAAALATTPMAVPPPRPSMAGPGGAPPADFPVGVPSPALYDELRRGRVGPGFASGQGYAY